MRTWLRDLRLASERTQEDLAGRLGISTAYYSLIEQGRRKRDLSLDLARKISAEFRVPLEAIGTYEDKLKEVRN